MGAVKKLICAAVLLASSCSKGRSQCSDLADGFSDVEYINNYDGDSLLVNIPGIPAIFGARIPVRVAHVDAPEIKGATKCERDAAIIARNEVSRLLGKASTLALRRPTRDKYFRIGAEVLVDNKIDLSKYLIEKRLAYPYEGGTKKQIDWCTYGIRRK